MTDIPDDRPLPLERLDPDTASDIIRRATELEQARTTEDPGVDRFALESAASEVGLSPAAVRQAMAEHDAGALGPADEGRSILGPARARSVRTVDLPPHLARGRVEKWTKSQLLQVHRRTEHGIEWRRRDDLEAKVRRKLSKKSAKLSNIDALITSVADDGNGRSIVRLEADLTHTRSGLKTGVVGVPTAAGPVLGGVAAMLLGDPLILVAGIPAGLLLGGTGVYVARQTLATERDEAQRVIDLYLDDLDRGT